jgi:hypothetical protein
MLHVLPLSVIVSVLFGPDRRGRTKSRYRGHSHACGFYDGYLGDASTSHLLLQ